MKNLVPFFLIAILFLTQQGKAQSFTQDSAALIVDNYTKLLNYDGIRSDSILYIETTIVSDNQTDDTLIMRRWFLPPNNNRVEFWQKGKRQTCFHSDGEKIFRKYDTTAHAWASATEDTYYMECSNYDYHGPLYKWNINGVELFYKGTSTFEGTPIYVVHVEGPSRYDRNYFFEKSTGLLFFVQEFPTIEGKPMTAHGSQVDWRAIHEFTPFGNSVLPTQESYQHQGIITVMKHTYKYLAPDKTIFKKDYPQKN